MTKRFSSIVLTSCLLSFSAVADDFFCELNIESTKVTTTADYPIKKAQVSSEDYDCFGRVLPNSVMMEVILQSSETQESVRVTGRPNLTIEFGNDNQNRDVTCTCGLK